MAPLSNAERQARHRVRMKQRASLDSLGDRTREAVDHAIAALWSYLSRPDADGRKDAALDGMSSPADLRALLAREGSLADWCRDLIRNPEDMAPDEMRAITLLVEVADAIELAAERPEKSR